MAIGGSVKVDYNVAIPIAIGVLFALVFFGLVLYLINLKYMRMRAEKWLECHTDVLFGTTWGSMTEIEILETLVKNKNLAETMLGNQGW